MNARTMKSSLITIPVSYTHLDVYKRQVEDGSLDANYFQHQAYLDQFNEEQGTHLVSVASIHYEPYAIYPGKTATLEEVYDGATIAVPNDGTNEGRALLLLQNLGWITLADGVGHTATVLDIVDNPMNLQIEEMEAAQITIALPDVDFAVIKDVYKRQELSPAYRQQIATAKRIANPGCYATGANCILFPLRQAGILPADYPVTIHAVSGYSGCLLYTSRCV